MSNIKARKHLSRGMMRVMRTSPFYTTILLKHQMVEDPNVNGMVINGESIRYHPDAIMTQTPEELGEYLKSMAMHIAFKHHVRAAEMRPRAERLLKESGLRFEQVFNQAADLSIHSLLYNENWKIWQSDAFKDAPMPGRGKFEEFESGESTESYFPKVLKVMEEEAQEQQNQSGANPPPCNGGQGGAGEGDSSDDEQEQNDESDQQDDSNNQSSQSEKQEEEKPQPMDFGQVEQAPKGAPQQAEDKADEMIAQAIMAAKEAGEKAGSVQSIIAENEKPVKVDWRSEVSQFFTRNCRGKKNYRHLNRRRWGTKIVFPTNKDKSPKRMLLLVDVSGSMSDECVGAVYNHIEAIIQAKPRLVVELVPFDDGVFEDSKVEFTPENIPIKVEKRSRIGYGGTRFMPTAEYAEKRTKEDDISGVVMLTDRLPCDKHQFDEYRGATVPWLILSVLEHQFGKSSESHASTPRWAKILEIEP